MHAFRVQLPPNPSLCVPPEVTSTCHGGMFDNQLEKWAQLCFVLLRILFWMVVAGYLHHIKWYWVI